MKKRFWALFLAVMMVVSVLPTTAFADADDEPVRVTSVSTPDSSPVKITKSVNDAGDRLTMEAYVTGQVVTTNPEPLDIVLVLDVSGSMKDDISIVKEENVTYSPVADREPIRFFLFKFDTNTNSYVCSDWENGGEYWYSEDGETFYPVTKIERIERKESGDSPFGLGDTTYVHYEYTYTVDGENRVYATEIKSGTILGNAADNEVVQRIYYKTVKTQIQTVSKMKALQDAVKKFISATAEKNQNVDAASQHRISIVKFAGDTTDDIGNLTYESGRYQYNYSQIVKKLTVVDETGADELTKAVNSLEAAGATSADYGMAHAKTVLADSTRSKVIIFFTDGEPNHGNGFSPKVANDTIGYAKYLKDHGATIYTVGVMAGANPGDTTSNINKYMHAVSSNYPDAASLSNMGTRAEDSDFYKIATDEGGLKGIFGEIAEEMIPAVSANEDSILMDTVSEWFLPVVPENATGVSATLWSAGGTDAEPTWTVDSDCDVTAEISDQKVTATGFDYSAHPVIKTDQGWIGKKLVISFAIAPNAAANWTAGTNLYPTNDTAESKAGLYPESGEAFASLDRSPTVPITAYSVTYDGNGGSFADGVKHEFNLLGGADMPTIATANEPTRANYSFQGWGTTNKATDPVTLPATVTESVTYYAIWEKNPDQYSVTYDGNGATTGTVPTDSKSYNESDAVTVLGNTGNLDKTATVDGVEKNFVFAGWNTNADGTGTTYQAYDTFTITGNTTLYAIWETDDWDETNNQPTGGDGIPDKYQVTVKYEAINGSIISTPISEVLTIRNDAGQFVPSGTVTISGAKAESDKGAFNGWTSNNNAVDLSGEDDTLSSLKINAVGGTTYTFTASFGDIVDSENISKDVVANEIHVDGITIPDGITYPGIDNAGNVLPVIAKAGDQITLLYAITVTGGQGDVFVVTEETGTTFIGATGCDLMATMSIPAQYVGTLTGSTSAASGASATLYFAKTFTIAANTEKLCNSIVLHDGTTKTEEVPVLVPGIQVEKTVNKTSVTVGDKIIYTITVKNTGNVDLTNVEVKDTFVDGGTGKLTVKTGNLEIGTLAVGEEAKIELEYTTTSDDRNGLKNTAVATATEVEKQSSSVDVTVKSEPITPVGPSKPQLNYEDHYAYVVGYPDGLVHPERNITRAEVATIFFRMLLDESREYFWAQENDFSDVAETDWFNNAVSTLANAQLINGYPDGSYRPNANITRAEFATIAIRFFLDEDVEIEENNLSDVKGHWAEANINLAYALELINGYPDGTFRPDQKITRAEAMAIVNRVLKRAPEKDHLLKDMIEWPDNLNTAAWYYADVQEATNSHKFHMDKEEEYEIWTELLPVRDWVALEQEWSKANSSKNPGEVVDIKITTPEAGDNGLKLD